MSTTFGELKRRVLLKIGERTDGRTIMAVEDGINEAHKAISRVRDFDELIVLDTTSASTTAEVKMYHMTDDLNLVRPKDIYTIRYMDAENSRKLEYVPVRELDNRVPYTEVTGTGRPKYYVRRGMYIELYPIPDDSKPLYILHSQWPPVLSSDSDETPYMHIDDVIVALATEIALSTIEEHPQADWIQRAKMLLGEALTEDITRPDEFYVARPFRSKTRGLMGKYWLSPWTRVE